MSLSYSQLYRNRRKAAGLCINCGLPVNGSGVTCPDCLKWERAKKKELRSQRAEQGLCSSCGKVPPMDGYMSCRRCYERHKAANERQRGKHNEIRKSV